MLPVVQNFWEFGNGLFFFTISYFVIIYCNLLKIKFGKIQRGRGSSSPSLPGFYGPAKN